LENRRNRLKPAPLLASKTLGYISYAVTPIFYFFLFFLFLSTYKGERFLYPHLAKSLPEIKEVFQKSKVHSFLSASREPRQLKHPSPPSILSVDKKI